MKTLIWFLFLFFITCHCYGQKQNNTWYFGDNAALNFNTGAPVALTNSKMRTNEGSSSISDKQTGQLLFYTNGINVWNVNNQQMPNGNGLMGNQSSTQSALIIPMPGSSAKYYLFTVDAQAGATSPGPSTNGYGGVAYNIVDMSLNGGLGDIGVKNKLLLTPTDEKLAAVPHCNGHDIWFVTHQWNSNAFYAYLISDTGISSPVISNSGTVHQDVGSGANPAAKNAEAIGYLKFSPDGKKLALACYFDLNIIEIFDFDNSSGVVSNPATDNKFSNKSGADGNYGISFSPGNSKLYATFNGYYGDTSVLYQYDMQAGSNANIIASRKKIATRLGTAFTAIQNGPDGKTYVGVDATNTNLGYNYLDVINNPDGLGATCNYTSDAFFLNTGGSNQCVFGLPNLMENYSGAAATPYTATLTYPSGCTSNDTLTLTDSALGGTIAVRWDFGDPSSGINDTSNFQNATHTFSDSGLYKVKLIVSNACRNDTLLRTINVAGTSFTVNAGTDVTICSGSSAVLNASGGNPATYKWNPTTGLSCTTCANPVASPTHTTQYILADSGKCSTASDTVVIYVNPTPVAGTINSLKDTICAGFVAHLYLSGKSGSTQWQSSGSPLGGFNSISGDTSNLYSSLLTQTTYYRVIESNGMCSDTSAVFTETVIPVPVAKYSFSVSGHRVSFNSDSSKNAVSYFWNFGDSTTDTSANPTHEFDTTGTFHVCLTTTNKSNCNYTLCQNVMVFPTGTINVNLPSGYYVYPNPASDILTIAANRISANTLYNITDITGRLITTGKLTGNINRISIGDLTAGIYLLQVGDELKQTFKIIKD